MLYGPMSHGSSCFGMMIGFGCGANLMNPSYQQDNMKAGVRLVMVSRVLALNVWGSAGSPKHAM